MPEGSLGHAISLLAVTKNPSYLRSFRLREYPARSPYAYLCKECSRRLLLLRSRSQTGSGLGGFEYVKLLEPRRGGALIGGGGGGKKLCKHA